VSRRPHSSPVSAVATSEACNEDIEEGDDTVDDGFEDCADGVDDAHEAGTDGAEDALDLWIVSTSLKERHASTWQEDIRKRRRHPF
jgi:hypothetical protein